MDNTYHNENLDPNEINMNVVNNDHHVYDSVQVKTEQAGPKNTNEASQQTVTLKMFCVAMFVMFVFCVVASLVSGIIVYNLVQAKGESNEKVTLTILLITG